MLLLLVGSTVASALVISPPRASMRALGPCHLRSCTMSSSVVVREAAQLADWGAGASILRESFGGLTLFHASSLRMPEMTANVFFTPLGSPVVAIAADADDAPATGVAQLLRVQLRDTVGPVTSAPVAFIQSVAVAEASRRRGIGHSLVKWCEQRALAQWAGDDAVDEVWLAVGEANSAAISLYEALGYERRATRMKNVLMSKPLARKPATHPAATRRASAPTMSGGGAKEGGGLFGSLFSGLANALESALDAAFPGQLEVIAEAETLLRASPDVVSRLGADLTLGAIDASESMSVTAGVQITIVLRGSGGEGTAIIGAARQDDEEGGGLKLEVLRVKLGDEYIEVLEPGA
jgi:GNAT superfamily N-acetyltransferase